MNDNAALSRTERITDRLMLVGTRGLEIGPLFAPIVTRADAEVRYLDVHLTPGLREHYAAHPGIPTADIVDVDFALISPDGQMRPPLTAIGDYAPVDWVVASHVIEHVPDVIGWLRGIADILVDGGLLALAIPDRRYCFDMLRAPTTVGEMLDAHLRGDTAPSVRAVYDHHSQAVTISAGDAWAGHVPGQQALIHDRAFAWSQVEKAGRGEYVDCHVWLLTPESLIQQLGELAELHYLDFSIEHVRPTAVNELEFYLTLRRLPRGMIEPAKSAAIQASLAPALALAQPTPAQRAPSSRVRLAVRARVGSVLRRLPFIPWAKRSRAAGRTSHAG